MIKLKELANKVSDDAFGRKVAYWSNILQLMTFVGESYKDITKKWIPLVRQEKIPNKTELINISRRFQKNPNRTDIDTEIIKKINILIKKI